MNTKTVIVSFFALVFLTNCSDSVDRCLDAGGRWVDKLEKCECTDKEREDLNISGTSEQELKACRLKQSKPDLHI